MAEISNQSEKNKGEGLTKKTNEIDFEKAKKRYTRVQSILRFLVVPFIKSKYNYEYDDFSHIQGPYLLLSNHNENLDPALVGMATKETLSYVATENAFRSKIASFLLNIIADVIIHKKGKVGFGTVLNMQKRLKKGNSVLLFPEGNRSFNGETMDIDYSALVMVAAKCKIPIVTFRMEGGYLTHPRWSTGIRKGKIKGVFKNVYYPEQLKTEPENVCKSIKEDLYTNAFAYQKSESIPYKGKDLALGMESTLFACPACKTYGKLHSDSDHVYCECGLKYQYNEYGQLVRRGEDVSEKSQQEDDCYGFTILDWDKWQKEDLLSKLPTDISFPVDNIELVTIGKEHSALEQIKGQLFVEQGQARVSIEGKNHDIEIDNLEGLSIFSRNTMNVYYNNTQYEIKGDIGFNALKYLYLFEYIKNKSLLT